MRNTYIGTPMERREDLRFLRGRGEFVDDLAVDGLLHAVILRSSVAHGRIVSLDVSAALRRPGVHAVITAADMPGGPPIIPMRLQPLPQFKPYEQPVIAHDKVRYVGEPIAVVLADSVASGEDALEAIAVEIEPIPAVADWAIAALDASLLFEATGTNRSLIFQARKGDADAAFRDAPYVRREVFRTGRHYGLTMEPRGVMAQWDAAAGKLTVSGAAKVPFFNRRILAKQIGLAEDAIEMIENDVGGGYGARGEFYPEDFLIPFAARHVNRPVKWIEDRRENLMAMNHAREAEADLEIACARDGTILALRGEVRTDMGAYMRTNGAVGARNVVQFMAGPYRVPHVKLDSHLWMTNKTPVGTYRGPGRFESNFFLERLLEMVAADLGIDRVELRRRNLLTQAEQPYPIAHVQPTDAKDQYDSGEYSIDLRSLPPGNPLGREVEARRQADRRRLSRPRHRLLHRGRRRRPQGDRTARDQRRRHDLGLSRHHVGGAGRRNHLRADRRRCARNSDRSHPPRLSRLDRLCERRLRRLSLALDRDGRLGAARRRARIFLPRCARRRRSGWAAIRRRSSSTRTR